MRIGLLFSVSLGMIAIAGCESERGKPRAGSTPPRDVTLPTQAPPVEIASPVELRNLQPSRSERRSKRPRSASAGTEIRVLPARPAPSPVVASPVVTSNTYAAPVAAASTASEPANDRDLAPGETVTVIPVSNGPSMESEPDELPLSPGRTVVGGGGNCRGRGRGPGIGIATAPRPHFR